MCQWKFLHTEIYEERSLSTLQYDIVDSLCFYRSLYDGSNDMLIDDHETFRSSQPANEDLCLQLHLLFHFRWNNFVCHWPHVRIVPFTAGPIDLCSLLAQSRVTMSSLLCAVGHWSQHWVLGLLAFWAPLTKTPWEMDACCGSLSLSLSIGQWRSDPVKAGEATRDQGVRSQREGRDVNNYDTRLLYGKMSVNNVYSEEKYSSLVRPDYVLYSCLCTSSRH